jgi:hypothetical protein
LTELTIEKLPVDANLTKTIVTKEAIMKKLTLINLDQSKTGDTYYVA